MATETKEAVDFDLPNGPLGTLVLSTVNKHDVIKEDEEHSTTARSLEDTELEEDELDIPPDLLKAYHCGVGPCHPGWLQCFANKKFFTFLLCLFSFIQGAVVSGFTSVILSTIQTRYQFTSTAAGFIAVSYDVTVTLSIIFISYFGGKTHRPRWLGASLIVLGVGALLFASPQFLFGPYDAGSGSTLMLEVCQDTRNFTAECSISNDLAYSTFILGNILIGIGAAPLYTVGMAYIDELVYPKFVPIHFGVFQMVSVLGPAFGYGVGSGFLSVYVDPFEETSLTPLDPAWVGAWWIPFILIACSSLALSVLFFMFPKWLSDSHLVRKERSKEMAKIYDKKYANEDSLTIVVKMFPIHIKQLLTNPPFVFHTISLSFLFILVSGFVSFAPKFFQNQFQLTATFGGLLSGGVGITAAGVGTMTGGIVLYLTKMRGKKLALFITTIIALMIPITPSFLLNCPSLQVAGISVPYHDGSQSGEDSSACSMNCTCDSTVFEPVCGSDGVTYFSPCRAGCFQSSNESTDFVSCLCIAEGLVSQSLYHNSSYSVILSNHSTANNGRCDHQCSALAPFVVIITITFFMVFIIQIPIAYFTVRVVADDQRSLALGLSSAVYRLFGTIPGPLTFGALFDTSCLNWQDDCGRRGNCWVHDNDQLSLSVLGFSIPCLLFAAIFFLLAVFTYPKQQQSTNDSPKKKLSISMDKKPSIQLVKVPMSPRRRSSNYARSDSTCSDDVLLNGTHSASDHKLGSTPDDDGSSVKIFLIL